MLIKEWPLAWSTHLWSLFLLSYLNVFFLIFGDQFLSKISSQLMMCQCFEYHFPSSSFSFESHPLTSSFLLSRICKVWWFKSFKSVLMIWSLFESAVLFDCLKWFFLVMHLQQLKKGLVQTFNTMDQKANQYQAQVIESQWCQAKRKTSI